MLDIHFSCTGIKDVSEFIEIYPNLFPPDWQNYFAGEKSGVFTIIRNETGATTVGSKHELKEIFKLAKLESVLNDFNTLSIENEALKKEIEELNNQLIKASPKQNLEVNKLLISAIQMYRMRGMSFQKIANKLNEDNYKNSRGNPLNSMQVKRLFDKHSKG